MPQFDGELVVAERLEQPLQVIKRGIVVFEARRKLREKGAQLAACRERLNASLEIVEVRRVWFRECVEEGVVRIRLVGARPLAELLLVHLRVRELLVELHRELEARRRPVGPLAANVHTRLTVKG